MSDLFTALLLAATAVSLCLAVVALHLWHRVDGWRDRRWMAREERRRQARIDRALRNGSGR